MTSERTVTEEWFGQGCKAPRTKREDKRQQKIRCTCTVHGVHVATYVGRCRRGGAMLGSWVQSCESQRSKREDKRKKMLDPSEK